MSVLIKGLIMPSCCDGCTFSDWSNLHQTASCKLHDYDPCFSDHSREYTDKRADFCPLVEVSEPHGRLIDADALIEKCGDWYVEEGTESGFIGTLKNLLATMPTVQPEKAQLSPQGATSDLISKTETVEHLRRVLDATVPNTDYDEGYIDGIEFGIGTVSTMPTIQPQSTTGQLNDGAQSTVQSTDLISRQEAIDALWKALYEYEDETEKQFQESEDLDVGDWIEHRIFVQNMNDIDRQTILNLPSAQPEPQWISVTERLPDNADHPGAFCPRYQVVTPYGVTEGWYRPHDHEKGGQWFALFWFMSQIYEIWNIDFERGDVPKVIGEAPVMEWRPLPEPYKPNNK